MEHESFGTARAAKDDAFSSFLLFSMCPAVETFRGPAKQESKSCMVDLPLNSWRVGSETTAGSTEVTVRIVVNQV